MNIRIRIFEIIEVADENDTLSRVYDVFMMITIILSLFPLAFKHNWPLFDIIEIFATIVFILDYILRLITSDLKLGKGKISFIRYPFTFMAIIDILSVLPSIAYVNNSFRLLRVFRLFKTFRVFRVFKAFRYSKNIKRIKNVFNKQKEPLIIVCILAGGYILIASLIVFNIEPETFDNFFDAIYWATVSLTTVGYGDIYPVSTAGKIVTMVSSVMGIAIVALPAGIITAGYLNEIGVGKD